MDTKKCFKCKEEKLLSGFYAHPSMSDGHVNKCIKCTKKDVMLHRSKNLEKVRAYDRERGKLPHRKKGCSDRNTRTRKQDPVPSRARLRASRAVRSGKIKRPELCSVCQAKGRLEGHHDDYLKPLQVIWLCVICHRQLHLGKSERADFVRAAVLEMLEEVL
jgi:hypothetical protein